MALGKILLAELGTLGSEAHCDDLSIWGGEPEIET